MAFYEVVYIIRPDAATAQVDQMAAKMADVIQNQGGKVLKTEQWGLRALAYRINKFKKGYYTMLGVDMPGGAVKEVERVLSISDDVIRFHSIKVPAVVDEPSVMLKFKARDEQDEQNEEAR